MRGKLIVVEGTDCSGKETQVKKAVAKFKENRKRKAKESEGL